MSWYAERILPKVINAACSSRPTQKQREKIVPRASGDVLEIGFGGGLNLPYYSKDRVRHLWALEPSEGMRASARERVASCGLDVELIDLPGEQIPLEDHSVDSIVITYTMCSIDALMEALDGMRRVLKPGGTLLYCEHGKAPEARVERWQDRLNPAWRRIAGGCNMNRDIPADLEAGGFRIEEDNRMYIPGIKALSYNYWGEARIR